MADRQEQIGVAVVIGVGVGAAQVEPVLASEALGQEALILAVRVEVGQAAGVAFCRQRQLCADELGDPQVPRQEAER